MTERGILYSVEITGVEVDGRVSGPPDGGVSVYSYSASHIGLADQLCLAKFPSVQQELAYPIEDGLRDVWPAECIRLDCERSECFGCLLHDDGRLVAELHCTPSVRLAELALQCVVGDPGDLTGQGPLELDDETVVIVGGQYSHAIYHYLLQLLPPQGWINIIISYFI